MAIAQSLDRIKDGRQRVVISGVVPEISCGHYPIKRTIGETVVVEADIFADGHDLLAAVILFRTETTESWSEAPMEPLGNDRWRGSFAVEALGTYFYTLQGWIDYFASWRRDLEKKVQAGLEVSIELLTGAQLLREAAERATGSDSLRLQEWAKELSAATVKNAPERVELALDKGLAQLMGRHPDRRWAATYEKQLRVTVDPVLARFGAWYEMFPRSCSSIPGQHGTFKDCERHLPRIAAMGFDVLYLPPIHPIGRSFRKGKNNHPVGKEWEVGSTWAIGAAEGGHKAIHPELGSLEDFRHLVNKARDYRLQIALDIAFQCAPDHPYVSEKRSWFRQRPDGTIQYAENPPKKYQDIYPFDFESEDWRGLWEELKGLFEYWIEQGVTIFRVDNPHTKPFLFWHWLLGELKQKYPELILLSEAFTRPQLMYHLAKVGFTQSYNYFPWRNNKYELTQYFQELTQTGLREYFRPNLWPNTPDILTSYLQEGGRPAFVIRLLLAATLGASYGIYGPAFELCENRPRETGSEEYLDSEKYEIKHWDLDAPGNLTELITTVNRIRRENPALQSNDTLHFHAADNDQIIVYSKHTADRKNIILTVVNLDPHHAHGSFVHLALDRLGLNPADTLQVYDLLDGAEYLWQGNRNYVLLDPQDRPAHIFQVQRRMAAQEEVP